MSAAGPAMLIAFAVGTVGAWTAVRLAPVLRLVDHPGPRKPHRVPVPLGGGVSVATGVTVAVVGTVGWPDVRLSAGMWGLVGLGLVDDARGLRARTRLVAQVAAVVPVALAWAPSLGVFRPVEVLLASLWILGVINATNCIDCADGVAAGTAIVGAVALGAVGGWDGTVGTLGAALAGATGGFLVFNAPPARCFLGDSGSTGIGFLLAILPLGTARGLPPGQALPIIVASGTVLSVVLLDFVLVHLRRARAGVRSIADLMASADTDHLPHRFRRVGLGPKGVAAACAGSVSVAGLAAHVALSIGLLGASLGALGVGGAFLVMEGRLLYRRGPAGDGEPSKPFGRHAGRGSEPSTPPDPGWNDAPTDRRGRR